MVNEALYVVEPLTGAAEEDAALVEDVVVADRGVVVTAVVRAVVAALVLISVHVVPQSVVVESWRTYWQQLQLRHQER